MRRSKERIFLAKALEVAPLGVGLKSSESETSIISRGIEYGSTDACSDLATGLNWSGVAMESPSFLLADRTGRYALNRNSQKYVENY
jgi:hypothetical protein